MTLVQALETLRPGEQWKMVGSDYSGITWLDSTTKPTEAELNAVISAQSYKELRKKAYPPIGDQLDALWKGGQAATDMKAIVDAVKTLYPKP